jgi:hypothetical protein
MHCSHKWLHSFSSDSFKMAANVLVKMIWKCCAIRKSSEYNLMVFVIYLYFVLYLYCILRKLFNAEFSNVFVSTELCYGCTVLCSGTHHVAVMCAIHRATLCTCIVALQLMFTTNTATTTFSFQSYQNECLFL